MEQLNMIKSMGSMRSIMERLPFFSGMADKINVDENEITKIQAMIQSMTEQERKNPDLMFARSRQIRVAKGSGRTIKEVGDLMQRFTMMKNMMGRLGTNTSWLSKIPGLGQLNTLRQLSKIDFSELFGSMVESAMPQGMDPQAMLNNLPRGYTPPGFQGNMMARPPLTKEQKAKRKLARENRKKNK